MPQEVSQFFEILLKALIMLVVPAITYAIYVYLKARAAEVWANMDDKQRAEFMTLVGIVVQAAEQSGLKGVILNEGKAKKQYAIDVLQAAADSRGIKISVAEIAAVIEQAIYQGVHKDKMAFIKGQAGEIIVK